MNSAFPKTDLVYLLGLPKPIGPLALLAALRFLTPADLIDADAGEVDSLVQEGLVRRFTLQRRLTDEEPTPVLALSRAGAKELARAMEIDPVTVHYSTKTTCDRSAFFLDHTLARNRFALGLARGLVGSEHGSLLSCEHDRDRLADSVSLVRETGEWVRQPLEADGLAVVRRDDRTEGLLIEIDRGTEPPSYLGAKYAGYLEWWKLGGPRRRFGLSSIRILTVAPDARRTERLRMACALHTRGKAGGIFWFAAEDAITKHGIRAPIWSTTRAPTLPLWL